MAARKKTGVFFFRKRILIDDENSFLFLLINYPIKGEVKKG